MNNKINTPSFWNIQIKKNQNTIIHSPIYIHKNKIILNELKNINGKMLDVGIGYGHIEKLIYEKKLDLKLYGLDISEFAINSITKKYKGRFIIGDVDNIPFNKNYFNCVLALDILEHLNVHKCTVGLLEINRVLDLNGLLIISVPLNENKFDTQRNRHIQKYSLEKIERQLKKTGFQIKNKFYLSAFRKFYRIKYLLNKLFQFSNPNLLIVVAKKK